MSRRTVHLVLDLLIGAVLFAFGALYISADIRIARWIAADPVHHHGMVGVGTLIGILPFLMGCWLLARAVPRWWSRG